MGEGWSIYRWWFRAAYGCTHIWVCNSQPAFYSFFLSSSVHDFYFYFFPNSNLWYLGNLITFFNCVKMSAYRLVMDCWLQEFTQRLGIHHSLFEWCGESSESNNIFTFPWLINWPFKCYFKLLSKTKFCTWGIDSFLFNVFST